MALKFDYNKTTIQDLGKQLSIREKALPILQNKETALRKEVIKRQERYLQIQRQQKELLEKILSQEGLWSEIPQIIHLAETRIIHDKIIGVKVPRLRSVEVKMTEISWWHYPAWVPTGIRLVKDYLTLELTATVLEQQIRLLVTARKKTTQKVNLYEKVQIPEMKEAIRKIKRFLEDKENIAKAAQKIMKSRKERRVDENAV